MRVTILSESPADEAAVQILVEAVMGRQVEWIAPRSRRAGGIHGVLAVLPSVLKELHYQRTADALVVVIDSNGSPVHTGALGVPCGAGEECRLCRARSLIERILQSLKPFPSGPIVTAVGLAVPAIEAWYLCGKDPSVSENAWVQGLREKRPPYTRPGLKKTVYGNDRPGLTLETARAVEEMLRVAADIEHLHRKFPVGFGSLLQDLRAWPSR
jgi:hypothetical protein